MTEPKALTKKRADLLRTKVQDIVESHAQGSMDLCWALYEIDHTVVRVAGNLVPVWETWGYKTWDDFVGKEVGLHPHTAHLYKRVWEVFYVDLAGAWDANLRLGITKMRILCAANLNRKNVNSWLKKAKGMTCAKLLAEVYDTQELHSFTASVTSREMAQLKKGVEAAREAFGEDLPRGQALVKIVNEWTKIAQGAAKPKLRLVSSR